MPGNQRTSLKGVCLCHTIGSLLGTCLSPLTVSYFGGGQSLISSMSALRDRMNRYGSLSQSSYLTLGKEMLVGKGALRTLMSETGMGNQAHPLSGGG